MRIKDLVPPIIPKVLSSVRGRKFGWFGNYKSWEEALKSSGGYDSAYIAEKVKDALLKVKRGEAVCERDSVLFDKIEYSWPLLGGLMWVAAQDGGKLSVLDFGGSLGSTYFQNLRFLSSLRDLEWNVVEQDVFVRTGEASFQDNTLRFYRSFNNCYEQAKPNVVLFSCVLQYLERPFEILQQAFDYSPRFIIIDNMPFTSQADRITVQKVPPEIYTASYPCWLLNKEKFLAFFEPHYEMVADFTSDLSIIVDSAVIPYEGFIFRNR